MNNKVKFLRGTSNEYTVAEKDSDTIYFTTDDGKLYIGDKEISGSDVTIDDTLSDTSTNPVQNKVVKQAIDNADNTYALKSKYGDTTIDVGRKADTDIGRYSTAEGYNTTASGYCSHAEGRDTTASSFCSHAGGYNTTALHNHEVAYGRYNESNNNTLFSIGDGTADDARHNAFEITTTGGKLHDKDIATTDLIPTELPANGGNADTVDGLHASDFMPYIGVVDDLFAVNKTCICAYGQNTLNTPLKAGLTESGGGLCFVNLTNGAEWANYIVMPSGDEHLYSATSKNGVLSSEWRRINDRNADTVGGFKIKVTHITGSTDQYGNLLLWTVVDNKRPFLVIIDGHYAIPFPVADSNDFYFYAAVIDYTNHSSVPNTSISADVYYLE